MRIKHRAEVEAASETREWAKPIQPSEYVTIRKAFVAKHGEIEDKVTPAKEYLEKKLHELEGGEFRAETLGEVVSRDEVDPDMKKASSSVSMPTGPEQFRHRLTVMQNALLMMVLKHPDRPELKGIDKDLFDRYKDYILGVCVRAAVLGRQRQPRPAMDLGAQLRACRQEVGLQADGPAIALLCRQPSRVMEGTGSERATFHNAIGIICEETAASASKPLERGQRRWQGWKEGRWKNARQNRQAERGQQNARWETDMFSVPIERWMSKGGQVPLCPCVLPLLWQPRWACVQDGIGRRQERGCGSRYARCSLTPSRCFHR